jgi:PhnB protein
MANAKKAVPEGFSTVTPQLACDDAASLLDWYQKALGAKELSRSTGPDGKVMHAEIQIGNSRVMVNDAMMGAKGPLALGGSPASLWVYVDDADTLFNRAVSAGGQVRMPIADQFWGDRCGAIVDPGGYTWTFATRKEDLTMEEINARASEFFKQFAQQAAG